MTNFENLKKMNSQEMVNAIFGYSDVNPCGICEYCDYEHCANNDCMDGARLWLNREANNG